MRAHTHCASTRLFCICLAVCIAHYLGSHFIKIIKRRSQNTYLNLNTHYRRASQISYDLLHFYNHQAKAICQWKITWEFSKFILSESIVSVYSWHKRKNRQKERVVCVVFVKKPFGRRPNCWTSRRRLNEDGYVGTTHSFYIFASFAIVHGHALFMSHTMITTSTVSVCARTYCM